MKTIRIFISSPGDVSQERERASQVIQSLQRRYSRKFLLAPVFWENLPLEPDMSFQQGIDLFLKNPGVDVAVFILWSRLGSPLGASIRKADGSAYRSGTEREYDLMIQARAQSRAKEGVARPRMVIYTRRDDNSFDARLRGKSTAEKKEMLSQKELVESFMKETFKDAETGENIGAYHPFDRPVTFSQRLRTHLQSILDELAGDMDEVIWDVEKQGPPFLGLDAFQPEHADIFFGREEEILEARNAIKEKAANGCAFLLLSGASGSGKSSLARAGILPEILAHEPDEHAEIWRSLILTPAELGHDPIVGVVKLLSEKSLLPELLDQVPSLEKLAADLAKDAPGFFDYAFSKAFQSAETRLGGTARFLLVIDQLEELFTKDAFTKDIRSGFLSLLETFARSGRFWIIATVRSDFYQDIQCEPALVRMKESRGLLDVLPPKPDAIARLIEEPARLAGLNFEKKDGQPLSTRILRDAGHSPELLPLLEFVLLALFNQDKDNHQLTHITYEALGGVEGALRRKAETTFTGLSPEAQSTLPKILQSLVTLGDESGTSGESDKPLRLRAPLSIFPEKSPALELITAFTAARLFTTAQAETNSEPTVAVSHESLLRVWPRAVQWKDSNIDFLRTRARIATRMKEGSPLLKGDPLLDTAKAFLTTAAEGFTAAQRDWIHSAITQAEAKERQVLKRRRLAFTALSILTLAASGAAWWAAVMAGKARDEQARARVVIKDSVGSMVAFARDSATRGDVDTAAKWFREAVALDEFEMPSPAVAAANEFIFARHPQLSRPPSYRIELAEGTEEHMANFIEGGLVWARRGEKRGFWDLRFGQPSWIETPAGLEPIRYSGHGGRILSIRDGSGLVTHQVTEKGDLAEIAVMETPGGVCAVETSPAGHILAATGIGEVLLFPPSGERQCWKLAEKFSKEISDEKVYLAVSNAGDKIAVLARGNAYIWLLERRDGVWKESRLHLNTRLTGVGHLGFAPGGSNLCLMGQAGLILTVGGVYSMLNFPLDGKDIGEDGKDRRVNANLLSRARTPDGAKWVTFREREDIEGKPYGAFLTDINNLAEEKRLSLGDPFGSDGSQKPLFALSPDGDTFLKSQGGLVQIANTADAVDTLATVGAFDEVKSLCFVDARRVAVLTGGKDGNRCHFFRILPNGSGSPARVTPIGPVLKISMGSPASLLSGGLTGQVIVTGAVESPGGSAQTLAEFYPCPTAGDPPGESTQRVGGNVLASTRHLDVQHITDDVYEAMIGAEDQEYESKLLGRYDRETCRLHFFTRTSTGGTSGGMGPLIVNYPLGSGTVEIFDGRSLDLLAGFGSAWKFWWSDDRMIGFTLPGRRWVIYSYKDGQLRLESSGDLELDGRLVAISPAAFPGTFVAAIKQGDSDDETVGKRGFAFIRLGKDSATVSNKTYFAETADITLDPDSDGCAVREGIEGSSSLWDTSTGEIIAKSSTASPSIVTMEGMRKFLSPNATGGLELIHLKRPYRREPLTGASAAALESSRNVWGVEAHDIEGGWLLKLGWNDEAISLVLQRDGDGLRVIAEHQGGLETDSSGPKKVIRIKDKAGKVLFERAAGPVIREPAVEAGSLTLEAEGSALEFLRTHDLHPGEYHSNGESLFMARQPLPRKDTLAFLERALLQEDPARKAPEPFVVDRSFFASAGDPAFRMLADDFNLRAASPFDSTPLREAVSGKIAADSSTWDSWSGVPVSGVYPAEHPLTPLAVAYRGSLRKERTYPTDATLDDLAWISVRRLLREQPSAALSPVLQRDCLLAASWLRKMNGAPAADELVARCLELNPANLDALRAGMGHLEPDDSRTDTRIRDLAGHKDATLADMLNAAYEAAKLEKTALAGDILAAAEKRHPGKVTENPMVGWIFINLGKASDAHLVFSGIRDGLSPAEKPSEDLLAGLAISSWLDGRREDAIASYTAMLREEKQWVSAEKIRNKAWPEKEAGPIEKIRLAVLEGNADYHELAMIHPLGDLAFRAVQKARETARAADPAAWAYEQKNAAFWIEEAEKDKARPPSSGMEREISRRVLDFYRGALEVYTITDHPVEWVEAEYRLAVALSDRCLRFDPADRVAMLDEAIRRCSQLADVLAEGAIPEAAQSLADVTGSLSYFYLQANRPREAKEQAVNALTRAPDKIWIATNLALAHLLSDEWDDAEALMQEYGDEMLKGAGKSFWKVVEEDLGDLERHGIDHPNIARMRTYIGSHFSLGEGG